MVQDESTKARYRERAKELRSIAAQTRDANDREVILRAAEAYEQLANGTPSYTSTES
jgi:hypothetical protein